MLSQLTPKNSLLVEIKDKDKVKIVKRLVYTLLAGTILTVSSTQNIQATQTRTYVEDMHGRTLIYRSKLNFWSSLLASSIFIAPGLSFLYSGYTRTPNILIGHGGTHLQDPTFDYVFGGLLTAAGSFFIYDWYKNYRNLHIPAIMLTKSGIWYENKMKYRWNEIIGIDLVNIPVRNEHGIIIYVNYVVRITTNRKRFSGLESFSINQNEIAISREKLQKLMNKYWDASKVEQTNSTQDNKRSIPEKPKKTTAKAHRRFKQKNS